MWEILSGESVIEIGGQGLVANSILLQHHNSHFPLCFHTLMSWENTGHIMKLEMGLLCLRVVDQSDFRV
jgi:hypothetical protein